jgi:hypothetical protein
MTVVFGPVLAPSQDGRLELFVVGLDGNLYHRWQGTNLQWSGWFSHGHPPGGPLTFATLKGLLAITPRPDGLLELLAWDELFNLYRIVQTAINNGWSDWEWLGMPSWVLKDAASGNPVVTLNGNGDIELFTTSGEGDSKLYRRIESLSTGWSAWVPFSDPPGVRLGDSPAAASSEDGRVELFSVASDGSLYHTWETGNGAGPTGSRTVLLPAPHFLSIITILLWPTTLMGVSNSLSQVLMVVSTILLRLRQATVGQVGNPLGNRLVRLHV